MLPILKPIFFSHFNQLKLKLKCVISSVLERFSNMTDLNLDEEGGKFLHSILFLRIFSILIF